MRPCCVAYLIQSGVDKTRPATSFPRKVWNLLVGIKDALALIFLLLFFVALFGLLAAAVYSFG